MSQTRSHDEVNSVGKLSPAQVAKRIEKISGRKPHLSSVIRWIVKGTRGRKLPAIRVGTFWLIEPADADNYIQVLNATPESAIGISAEARVGAQLESIRGSRPGAAPVVVEVKPGKPVTVTGRKGGAR